MPAVEVDDIPLDTLVDMLVGVAEFRYIPASAAKQPGGISSAWDSQTPSTFIGVNLAKIFREKIKEIIVHEIGEDALAGYVGSIITAEKEIVLKKIDELRGNRDALIFSGTAVPDESKYDSFSVEIEVQKERLEFLSGLGVADIEVIREKNLKLLSAGTGTAEELFPPVMDPRAAAAQAKVDYMLWGTLREEGGGLLRLSVSLYAARQKKIVFSGSSSGSVDQLDLLADRVFSRLASSLTGRSWATLDITTSPSYAHIYVDGELLGIGNTRLAYVKPGSYHLSFYSDGFEVLEQDIVLENESRQTIRCELTPVFLEPVLLQTFPAGADVYFGALKKGVTPLLLPLGATPDILSISLDGYKSRVLASTSVDLTAVHVLPRDVFSWDERIQAKRSDFYRSLGFTILTVPAMIFLYGAYQNESFGSMQYMGRSGYDYNRALDMQKDTNLLRYAYLGSVFLFGSLVVNTIQNLLDYIHTSEESQKFPSGRGAQSKAESEAQSEVETEKEENQ
ncbi:MAG: PEGA domain-containing protein [Spirochaetales bacterium]|nr:PEGA domain-containing protein [Spirochaetales bacterium]